MFNIYVPHTGISPYSIFFLMSFVVSFWLARCLMIEDKVDKTLANLMPVICFMTSVYCALLYTYVFFRHWGVSSVGGLLGLLISVITMSMIFKQYKHSIFKAYCCVIPLLYGISKLGCFSVGCCHGRLYDGMFSVTYTGDADMTDLALFPAPLFESILFMLIFIMGYLMIYTYKMKYGIELCLTLCCAGKFSVEYLRYDNIGKLMSINQVFCIGILIVTWISVIVRKIIDDKYNNHVFLRLFEVIKN